MTIALPDESWERFARTMWGPLVGAPPVDGPLVEVSEERVWGWQLHADGELLGKGRDPWFLAGEMRYWVVAYAFRRSPLHLLHASTVARDGRAVLLLAASGRGKTTLSLELADRGWAHHGDDLAAIDAATLQVSGIQTPAGIRDASRWATLSDRWSGAAPVAPSKEFLLPARAPQPGPIPVAALAFIEYGAGLAPVLEPVSAAEAMLLCAQNSTGRDEDALATYSALCRATRRGRLRYSSTDDALVLLEQLLGTAQGSGPAKAPESDTERRKTADFFRKEFPRGPRE